jgi:site-specific DNA-cytosine methylase
VSPDQVPAVQGVISGASCVPYSRQGKQEALDDERSCTLIASINHILAQATRDDSRLEFFLIENVLGMGDVRRGCDTSLKQDVMDELQTSLSPNWSVWCWRISTVRMGLPQTRERLYICGRKGKLFFTPSPLFSPEEFHFPEIPLRDILDWAAPKTDKSRLSEKMFKNLSCFKEKTIGQSAGTLCVCDLTRSDTKVYTPTARMDGRVPTLTTRNVYLWVFCVGDESMDRWLTVRERLMLQGWSPEVEDNLPLDHASAVRLVGNGMTMPAVGMALACTLSGRRV